MIRAAIGLLLRAGVCVAPAALAAQDPLYTQYRVQSFTNADGLPSNAVTDLVETRDGYLWIAAGGMLARFDGHEFRTQSLGKTPQLSRRVHVLLAGRGDTLWALDEALSVLAFSNGRGTAVVPPAPRGIFYSGIRYLAQGAAGAVFAIGADSAWVVRPGSEGAGAPDASDVPHWRDRAGTTWISSGLGKSVRLVGDPMAPATPGLAPTLVESSSGEAYEVRRRGGRREVVTAAGLVLFDYPDGELALPRLIDRRGRLWITTMKGLEVHERGNPVPIATLPVDGSRMIEGRDGCMWLTGSAVHRICPVAFHSFHRPRPAGKDPIIRFLAAGPKTSMLMIDETRTLFATTASAFRMVSPPAVDNVSAVVSAMTDRRGTIWWPHANTLQGSLMGGGTIELARSGVVLSEEQRGNDDILWFAGSTHIYRAEPYAADGPRITDSIPHHGLQVHAISATSQGVVWAIVATNDLGYRVLRYENGRSTVVTVADGLPTATLRSIAADDARTAWVGTYGAGLVRIRDGKVRTIQESDGLSDNVVSGMLEDRAGNFWMAGNRGVHRVARAQVEAFLDGTIPRVHGTIYGRDDGIPQPETIGTPGALDAAGHIWFPTLGGVVVVDPALAVALDTAPPIVHVLSITSDRDSIRVDDDATTRRDAFRLSLDARRLSITYTALSLRAPAGLRFEFRVDGVDDRWIYAGAARTATYTKVAPGGYTFRVRAISGSGVASLGEATLRFVVPPHFYETRIFVVALELVAGALVWLGFEGRVRQVRRREVDLKGEVAERTADLSSALETVAKQATELRTLDEAKSRFFANVSHEFRTPLTLILGPAEDLMSGRAGSITPPARRRLQMIVSNGRRLVQLVEQLLDVTRLESGKLQLNAQTQDLVPLVRRMADSFSSLAAQRQIAFRVSCPVAGVYVSFDADQMEKIITNLVGNALKFTPSGGSVELRARVEDAPDGYVVLEVQDSGPGIPAHHQPRVFDRFYQVDDSASRTHEGVGIGLALTKELVELHNGVISLHSTEGVGCTFTARFPMGRPNQARDVLPAPEPSRFAAGPMAPNPRGSSARRRTPSTGIGPEPSRDVLTVLIVEDNVELLDFLSDHLAQRFRVLSAPNGLRGLEMARECVPDLIVSDVMMPLMDGQAMCEAVKEDPEIDFIPVILLTAKASRESRLAGLTGGADDYLTKPVDLAELLIRADNLIASRRRVRERFDALRQPLPAMELPFRVAPRDASGEAVLRRFHAALAEHLSDPEFQVEQMAAAMGMSRTTLYRNLREHLEKSPMDAFWDFRLAQAAQWLEATSITISEVAYGVGFRSVPHFCTRFRERYAETPSAYRQRHARSSTSTPPAE